MNGTAVLISGQARTFADCVANQNWMVYRHLMNPTFFVSVADDAQARDMHLLENYFPGRVHVEIVKQPSEFDYMPSFADCRHAPYTPTPNEPRVVLSIMRQLWQYKRVWDFMCEEACKLGKLGPNREPQFITFVRMRPDLWFHRFRMPRLYFEGFDGPWKATCGGVNDRFSFMSLRAASAYFNAIDRLREMVEHQGAPVHPETIQRHALDMAGVTIRNTLLTEFTCVRLPGHGPHVPLVEYPGELAAFIAATTR